MQQNDSVLVIEFFKFITTVTFFIANIIVQTSSFFKEYHQEHSLKTSHLSLSVYKSVTPRCSASKSTDTMYD